MSDRKILLFLYFKAKYDFTKLLIKYRTHAKFSNMGPHMTQTIHATRNTKPPELC